MAGEGEEDPEKGETVEDEDEDVGCYYGLIGCF